MAEESREILRRPAYGGTPQDDREAVKGEMAVTKIFLLGLSLFFGATTVAFAEQAAAPVAAEIIDVGNTICPITGDKVSPKAFVDYEGKRYHFCCQNCVKKFRKNPEKWISKLERGEVETKEHAGHEHH